MPEILIFAAMLMVTEVLVAFLFAVIAQVFYKKIGFDFKAIFKGLVERLFLLIMLINGYAAALTFFSALKLATRLKHEEPSESLDKFNDYYLMGNLLSVLIAVGYVYLYGHLPAWIAAIQQD